MGSVDRFCWYRRFLSTVIKASKSSGGEPEYLTVRDAAPSHINHCPYGMAREGIAGRDGETDSSRISRIGEEACFGGLEHSYGCLAGNGGKVSQKFIKGRGPLKIVK